MLLRAMAGSMSHTVGPGPPGSESHLSPLKLECDFGESGVGV